MENPIKMDDLGGFPPIFGSTPTCNQKTSEFDSKSAIFFEHEYS